MDSKKMVFNEITKLFEEATEVLETNKTLEKEENAETFESVVCNSVKKVKKPLSIWLKILIPTIPVIMTVIGGVIAYQQLKADNTQAYVAIKQLELIDRQFNVEKMPQFQISSVDVNDDIQTIVLENTGATINNAALETYIYGKYVVKSQKQTYVFGIDMDNTYLTKDYTGRFKNSNVKYDVLRKSFTLEFEKYNYSENKEYQKLNTVFWKDIYERLNSPKGKPIDSYTIGTCIYFCISYKDKEKHDQQDWYMYDLDDCTLSVKDIYDPEQDEPEFIPLDLEYYATHSGYIAKCLGYTNSQFSTVEWFDLEHSYITLAEEKMLSDVKKYFGK